MGKKNNAILTLDYFDLTENKIESPFSKPIDAKPHSPVYTMHRYFARRPYNVFRELIKHYTKQGDIILDPFCGGGVTVVEGMLLKRKVVGVDINPLATFVTEMEVMPLDIKEFWSAYSSLKNRVQNTMNYLYKTVCPKCSSDAYFDWIEWENGNLLRIKYTCPNGHSGEKESSAEDVRLVEEIEENFDRIVAEKKLWYPKEAIPEGDKTDSMLQKGYNYFWQLFTKRNLLALALLHKEISNIQNTVVRQFLLFALSGTLKWASKQSHLRGEVVEGWAMHAYWIYPKSLEINTWETFTKRCKAVDRGKKYAQILDGYYKKAENFNELLSDASAMILNKSSDSLPISDESIDAIITDPPYGSNVNYGELADYWLIWLKKGIMDKEKEAVINKTQRKGVEEYEELLYCVFKECHRVLKKERWLVATFNSKDLVIISAFVKAVVRAGFELADGGLVYQPPIKAYTTTVHAKEVGAFTGDFIFTFQKIQPRTFEKVDEEYCKNYVDEVIERYSKNARTEIQLRKRVYEELIPLFGRWIKSNGKWIYEIAKYAEIQIKRQKFEELSFEHARAIAR